MIVVRSCHLGDIYWIESCNGRGWVPETSGFVVWLFEV